MTDGPIYLKTVGNGRIVIGDKVFLNHNFSATAMSKITISDGVMVGNNCVIVDHDHLLEQGFPSQSDFSIDEIYIGKGVWIGSNVTILKGVSIGDNAVIAAGAVVTHDVNQNTIVGGIPARFMREI